MRKIDKTIENILSKKYKSWVDKLENANTVHPSNYRYYYDDVAMNLYNCQKGVCAYTEMHICVPELYKPENWVKSRYKIPDDVEYNRQDHLGEMDHFDPNQKEEKYWLWENLFMIHAKINSIKTGHNVVSYLKPDLDDYSPELYFDYDEETHRYIPNTDIEDETKRIEIQHMIDKVLLLNHGVVKNERRDYINSLIQKKATGEDVIIDRFFTAASWCL